MKKILISFIIIFSILATGLTVLLVYTLRNGHFVFSSRHSNLKLVKTVNFNLADVDSITIEYKSYDIKLLTSTTNEVIIKEYMNFTPDEDELAQTSKNGTTLSINGREKKNHFDLFSQGYYGLTEIYLPADFTGTLKVNNSSGDIYSETILKPSTFDLSSKSGDIDISEVASTNIDISTSSGNITIEKAEGNRKLSSNSGDIEVHGGDGDSTFSSTSGNITVEKANGNMNLESSSGDIQVSDAKGEGNKEIETKSGKIDIKKVSGVMNLDSSSGDIEAAGISDGGEFNTLSGNITLSYSQDVTVIQDDINIKASSGEVELKLPSNLSFTFDASTTSGEISTYFDDVLKYNKRGNEASGTIGDIPSFNVLIKTQSGNIDLYELK